MTRLGMTFSIMMLLAGCFTKHALGLGTETIGNSPLNLRDYRDWPGVVPIVNHKSRVYQQWINGGEHLYYSGDTRTLNDVLKDFAQVQIGAHVVILRPGPATAETFGRMMSIPYDWNLHLVSGIARHLQDDSDVWDKYPTITIFVGGRTIELDQVVIPKGLTVLEPADLRARYLKGLESRNSHARGFAVFYLAGLDADYPEDVPAIAKLLEDEDNWVRLMAASALGKLGQSAAIALPALKRRFDDPSQKVREDFAEAIAKIEKAKPDPVAIKRRQETVARISRFVRALPPETRPLAPSTRPAGGAEPAGESSPKPGPLSKPASGNPSTR